MPVVKSVSKGKAVVQLLGAQDRSISMHNPGVSVRINLCNLFPWTRTEDSRSVGKLGVLSEVRNALYGKVAALSKQNKCFRTSSIQQNLMNTFSHWRQNRFCHCYPTEESIAPFECFGVLHEAITFSLLYFWGRRCREVFIQSTTFLAERIYPSYVGWTLYLYSINRVCVMHAISYNG